MTVALGQQLPEFSGRTTRGEFTLSSARGKILVLYFYPKDNTPGCSTQASDFRTHHAAFERAGARIVGVSRDSLKSHENFQRKFELPFELIADTDETLCTLFDVIRTKKLYGKLVRGIERSTFLIDPTGILVREWRGLKVPGHVAEVLTAVEALG
ncbi:MAG: peroxiredoxin [Burkholderiaceae bacterium]